MAPRALAPTPQSRGLTPLMYDEDRGGRDGPRRRAAAAPTPTAYFPSITSVALTMQVRMQPHLEPEPLDRGLRDSRDNLLPTEIDDDLGHYRAELHVFTVPLN